MTPLPFWVRPLDTLFAGPPHSATAGESAGLRSQFPLPSSTFQGLIRTRLLTGAEPALELSPANQRTLDRLIGTPEQLPSGWQLEGPFPMVQVLEDHERVVQHHWLPTPRFVFEGESDNHPSAQVLDSFGELEETKHAQPALNDLNSTSATHAPLYLLGIPGPKKAKLKPLEGWVSVENLAYVLSGRGRWSPRGHGKDLPPFVQYERRPGIAIDPETGVAEDQMLFFLETLRFAQGSGLAGILRTPGLPKPLQARALTSGVGHAGKAARVVAFEPLETPSDAWKTLWHGEHLSVAALKDRLKWTEDTTADLFVWLVLLTPLWLEEVNRPTIHVSSATVQLEIRGALLGDLITQGGYDRITHFMRPNRQLVPGGSCWLVRMRGGTLEQKSSVLRQLNAGHPLGDARDTSFGQGLTMVGLHMPMGRNS